MIVKVVLQLFDSVPEVHIVSKPTKNRHEKEFGVNYRERATPEMLKKMDDRHVRYFHAHKEQDVLILDDEIPDQNW